MSFNEIVLYPEDGSRFESAIALLRATALKRVRRPKEERLGITVVFKDRHERVVDTNMVRIHPDGVTFCWIEEYGEYREPLDQVAEVRVWRL